MTSQTLQQLQQSVIQSLPSMILGLVGLVVALVLIRRRWTVGVLAAASSLLILAADVLSIVFLPIHGILVGFTLGGLIAADKLGFATRAYSTFNSLVSTAGMALLAWAALLAIRGRPAGAPRPRPAPGGRFFAGLAGWAAAGLVAAVAIAALLGYWGWQGLTASAGSRPHPKPSVNGCPVPSNAIDPGTYTAGALRAPTKLSGKCLSPTTDAQAVADAKKARDQFSTSLGGAPSIFASYGTLVDIEQLYAGQGFVTPEQYFADSKVKYETYGQVRCATLGLSICIRSDQAQKLTVVVSGFPNAQGNGADLAQAVEEAWTAEGGH